MVLLGWKAEQRRLRSGRPSAECTLRDCPVVPFGAGFDAIYGYLTAVYSLVTWWAAEGQDVARAQRAVRLTGLDVIAREEPFAAVIRCTADAAKVDKRTRSKWSRLLRYADEHKLNSEPLDRFVKRKGGINECVARFSRHLGACRRGPRAEPR